MRAFEPEPGRDPEYYVIEGGKLVPVFEGEERTDTDVHPDDMPKKRPKGHKAVAPRYPD